MCGIVGVLNLQDCPPVSSETILQMLMMIRHRGPDGFGIYRDPQIGLGSARLSIIDLSSGDQPIGNEDGTLWIVFNGEIFNYVELRPELERRGHRFTTQTDTEVILHLYEELGPGCLQCLNGQFAIAIWDSSKRQLFLARDRMGVRPLFYTIAEQQLIFGSEVKALLAYPSVQPEIDQESLAQTFTFWSILPPQTMFRGIDELPPAHYLLVSKGQINIHLYWCLEFSGSLNISRPAEDYLEELESLLVDATRIRLRADVPVGAYLSGGLDSSLTTALIRRHTNNHLDTFSIAFADPDFDESEQQMRMADYLGTDHRVVHCTYQDIGEAFPGVIWHTEAPILRTAPAPMYLLSQLVNEHHLKVVVTGEGADELLGGYDIFKEMLIRRFWARDPESLLLPLLLKRLYPDIGGLTRAGWVYLTAFFKKDLNQTDSPFYSHQIRWRNANRLQRFLSNPPDASQRLEEELISLPEGFAGWSPLAQAQYLEIHTFLSSYLLSSQGDRVAMAHSVEGRYPFLDYRVVEFCTCLPDELKLYGLTEKRLLRKLGQKYLPDEIWRRPKRPYRAPAHPSFFSGCTPEYVHELLSQQALAESSMFSPQPVAQLVHKASEGAQLSEADGMALVGILSAQLIYYLFIKNFQFPSVQRNVGIRIKNIDRISCEQLVA